MRPAAKVAMSGICTALSVLLLFFGGVVPVLAYVCPMLTGVLMVVLVRTFGYGTAWITYVSTGLLSFFLVPDKECMLMYVLFSAIIPSCASGSGGCGLGRWRWLPSACCLMRHWR